MWDADWASFLVTSSYLDSSLWWHTVMVFIGLKWYGLNAWNVLNEIMLNFEILVNAHTYTPFSVHLFIMKWKTQWCTLRSWYVIYRKYFLQYLKYPPQLRPCSRVRLDLRKMRVWVGSDITDEGPSLIRRLWHLHCVPPTRRGSCLLS